MAWLTVLTVMAWFGTCLQLLGALGLASRYLCPRLCHHAAGGVGAVLGRALAARLATGRAHGCLRVHKFLGSGKVPGMTELHITRAIPPGMMPKGTFWDAGGASFQAWPDDSGRGWSWRLCNRKAKAQGKPDGDLVPYYPIVGGLIAR